MSGARCQVSGCQVSGRKRKSRSDRDLPEKYDRMTSRFSGYRQEPLTNRELYDNSIIEARASTSTYKNPNILTYPQHQNLIPLMPVVTGLGDGIPRASKMKLILKAFRHRFWDDFRGPGNVKNKQKRGRVPLEGPGTALGRLLEGFWEVLGGFQEASWTKDRKS